MSCGNSSMIHNNECMFFVWVCKCIHIFLYFYPALIFTSLFSPVFSTLRRISKLVSKSVQSCRTWWLNLTEEFRTVDSFETSSYPSTTHEFHLKHLNQGSSGNLFLAILTCGLQRTSNCTWHSHIFVCFFCLEVKLFL